MLSKRERDGSRGPRPASLLALALVCALAGYGIARASLDVDRAALAARDEGGADDSGTESGSADARPGSLGDASVSAEVPAPANTEPPRDDAPPAIAPPPLPAAPSAVAGTTHVDQGRVAYLRCEGLVGVGPTGPCPRDRDVERRVWEAIATLPTTCPALVGRTGEADVRVVFDGRRVSGLGFRDVPNALDREAVRGCLEPALADVRQTVGASRMTASFAFALRP